MNANWSGMVEKSEDQAHLEHDEILSAVNILRNSFKVFHQTNFPAMIANYFKVMLRHMARHKVNAFV